MIRKLIIMLVLVTTGLVVGVAVERAKNKNKNIKFTIVDKEGNLLADYNGKDLIHFDSVDVEIY